MSVMVFCSPFVFRSSTAKAICVFTSAPYPVSCGCEKGTSGAMSRFRLAVGVALSEAAEGEGDGGASDVALPADKLLGLESFAAAEASVPRKADDCFSRYDDMVVGGLSFCFNLFYLFPPLFLVSVFCLSFFPAFFLSFFLSSS